MKGSRIMMDDIEILKSVFDEIQPHLDEKTRRLLAASMANAMGHGGMSAVKEFSGMSLTTLELGKKQLSGEVPIVQDQIRKPGGGRKPITQVYPQIEDALLKLVSESTQGDPQSPLLWTTKSLSHLAKALTDQGMPVTPMTVSKLLAKNHFSMQANRKRFEHGSDHSDRDGQFQHINDQVNDFQGRGSPVISVDSKKKELIGNYKNAGTEYRETGHPREVNAHDFINPQLGKAIPYGIYDMQNNQGWVTVGTDHDTPEFAVASIRQWWVHMGSPIYSGAKELLITADGGGSNSSSARLWKLELQKFADETGLTITVCHFPPGTSKWNKIEHRMFSFISMNWRARPLTSLEVVVNLIGSTTTKTGLRISCALDQGTYETGRTVSQADMESLLLDHHPGQNQKWNYTIHPRTLS